MKISRREKILLLVVVYLLVVFGGYKFIVAPTQAKLAEAQEVNRQLDQLIQQSVQGGKPKGDSDISVSKELLAYQKLAQQLPQDKQLVELIDQIGKTANKNKVTLLTVAYVDSKQKTTAEKFVEQNSGSQDNQAAVMGVSKMDLDLSISGSYYHLLGFLQDLQKSARIIVVNSSNMAVGHKEDPKTGPGYLTYTSTNPPPTAPIAKGDRLQTSISTGTSGGAQNREPVVADMTKFDLGNTQMNLKVTSYYDTTQAEIEKLIGTSLFKKLVGADSEKDDKVNAGDVLKELKKTMTDMDAELKL